MKRYKRVFKDELKESVYLLDVFDFPEWSYFDQKSFNTLNSLVEKQDNLIEATDTDAIGEWLDSMQVNTFDDFKESQNLLIKTLQNVKNPSTGEKKLLEIAQQIQKILKSSFNKDNQFVYSEEGKLLAQIEKKGSIVNIQVGTKYISKETFEEILGRLIKK